MRRFLAFAFLLSVAGFASGGPSGFVGVDDSGTGFELYEQPFR
jgi:hypothetical protein